MISWEQVKQKGKSNPGQFVDWDDNPYVNKKPKKRIDQCFVVQDVVWVITITDKINAEVHNLECNNAKLEREFKQNNSWRFTW